MNWKLDIPDRLTFPAAAAASKVQPPMNRTEFESWHRFQLIGWSTDFYGWSDGIASNANDGLRRNVNVEPKLKKVLVLKKQTSLDWIDLSVRSWCSIIHRLLIETLLGVTVEGTLLDLTTGRRHDPNKNVRDSLADDILKDFASIWPDFRLIRVNLSTRYISQTYRIVLLLLKAANYKRSTGSEFH